MVTIHISLNGLSFPVDAGTRLDVLVDALKEGAGLVPSLVAVDSRYVPLEDWPDVLLRDGTRVDTVD